MPPRPRRSQASRAACTACADGSDEKPDAFSPILHLMIKFYGEGDCHILRVIVINSRTLHIKRVCPRTGPCCTAALVGAVTPATTKLHHAAPRLATRAAPGRAPEVHGRHDAPRRVDLEPREQVHRCGAARGTKAAFFSGLESETPSSGSDAVEPTPRKRAVPPPTPSKAEASSFTQAGTTALYLRKVMKKQRRPGDWWLPKASNSTSRSPPP